MHYEPSNAEVYHLSHKHTYYSTKYDTSYIDIKWLGIYSSVENAEKAIDRYHKLEGFNKCSRESFTIAEYTLNKDDERYSKGFESLT
ncbi:hypothetical protein AGMMS49975_21950 [Clostridia bacterium]|nr:hypothetical protein AGMMS49975_21950 [Clostridia bacterium]